MLNRGDSLKLSGGAALTLLAGEPSAASIDDVAGSKIKVAGYGYDRIQEIKDDNPKNRRLFPGIRRTEQQYMGADYWRYGIECNRM